MTNLNELVAATRKQGGGRMPHMDVFIDHISAEHADGLRELASDPMLNAAHFARIVLALKDRDYPSFPLGLSESAVRTWQALNS